MEVDAELPAYVPHPCQVTKGAGYVLPDGSVQIIGAQGMDVAFRNLNALFAETHPGLKFTMNLHGAATAIGGLYCKVSAFGPNVREFWPSEIGAFRMTYGYEPTAIRVAHGAFATVSKANPIAVLVNRKNPIEKLTTEQVARIFSTGGGRGDITSWGQLGLTGDWAHHKIHPIGPSPTTGNIQGVAVFMMQYHFGGYPYCPQYEEAWSTAAVVKRVSEETSAIGFASFDGFEGKSLPNLKIVSVAEREGGYYSRCSKEDVVAGRYPYLRNVYLYINREPGKPLDPFVKEYLEMVLSREGQREMIAQDAGFLPLSAAEAAVERTKLQ